MATADEIINRLKKLKTERSVFESHWQEVADYVIPRKADVTEVHTAGDKRRRNIVDSTAPRSHKILAAGLAGHLTSPSSPWFSLRTENIDLMDNDDVKQWLKHVEGKLYMAFNGSNWSDQVHENYLDLGAFGTGIIFIEAHEKKIVRFETRTVAECYLAENSLNEVDTVYRVFFMSVIQLVEEFDINNVSSDVRKQHEKKEFDKPVEVVHAVQPRYVFDPRKLDAENKKWESIYIEAKSKKILRKGGFDNFPFACPRWVKASNEIYGRSPAMEALPDVKMANAQAKTNIRAAQKAVDPPLEIPHQYYISPVRTQPGGINVVRSDTSSKKKIESLPFNARDIPIGLEMVERTQEAIKEAFFVNLFLMMEERPQMTATEVLERVEEKMVLLGPTLGRLQGELLNPVIDRVFSIMMEEGHIDEPPAIMDNEDYAVDYVSPLARAQKMQEVLSISRGLRYLAEFAQFNPEMLDKIDGDALVDRIWEIMGLAPEILRSDENLEKLREDRATQQENMMALQGAQMGADALSKVLKTLPEGERAAVLEAVEGEG